MLSQESIDNLFKIDEEDNGLNNNNIHFKTINKGDVKKLILNSE